MHRFYVDPDISVAKTLHKDFYTDQAIFDWSRRNVFAASWQFAGSAELVPGKGDVYPLTLLESYLDEPVVIVHDKEDNIHMLSNVCTHRGNLLADKPCNTSSLRCRYHGRQFELDGSFKFMPEFREVKNFPTADDNLRKLPLFEWENLLFTSVSIAKDPSVFFRDMMERVKWMPLQEFKFRPELSREFNVRANWAIYCENYLEGFHVPFVHESLNAMLDFGSYSTEIFYPYSNLQIGLSKSADNCFVLPESSPDYGKNVAACYFWVFPNMMFNFYPWGLSVNVVQPVSVNQCRVLFRSFVWDESKRDKGAGSELDRVEMEDEEIVENVQRGIHSSFYEQGRYSVTREKCTHHFHTVLSEYLKDWSA